jgi:uncharacterized membrane protein (DUF4010 family)
VWIVVAGLLGLSAAIAVANIVKMQAGGEAGITTETAGLVMFLVGAYLVHGPKQVAVVVAGAVAVLLYAKPVLHGLVRRIGDQDMRAMMQFVLITLVILPVLPDRPYGPFQALNPREIWWIVVLVVGISFAGYIALKLFGQNAGALLAGMLGGLISSTATTVSFARRASSAEAAVNAATLVIILASTVVYVRVLVEIAVVARPVLTALAGPIGVMLGAAAIVSILVWLRNRRAPARFPPHENPSELKAAIVFGVIYALVSLAVAAARHYFDSAGIYAVAGISGLADMDAITLSTAQMVNHGKLDVNTAWRAIVIASIANLVFKGGIVAMLGDRRLFRRVAVLFGLNIAVAVAVLVFWPASTGAGDRQALGSPGDLRPAQPSPVAVAASSPTTDNPDTRRSRRSVRRKRATMATVETTFPVAMVAKTAPSPRPKPRVQTSATARVPTTRTIIHASGIVARPRPWKAKATTMLTPTKG